MRDVTCTCLVAPFTYVIFSHGSSTFSDDVIMSFDIIIQYIKSFSAVYLPLKNEVIAVQTSVENYLIHPKISWKRIISGMPAPLDKSIPVVSSSVWTT